MPAVGSHRDIAPFAGSKRPHHSARPSDTSDDRVAGCYAEGQPSLLEQCAPPDHDTDVARPRRRCPVDEVHNFLPSPWSVRFNSLNTNVITSALGGSAGVWDNLRPTARKLLILKTERWPSGRRRTLGKRIPGATPGHSEAAQRTRDQRVNLPTYQPVCVNKRRCLRGFDPDVSHSYHNRLADLEASSSVFLCVRHSFCYVSD